MDQVGVIIDSGSLPASFTKKVVSHVETMSDIAFCKEENLISSEGLASAGRTISGRKAEKIVIVGASPKVYESSFLRLKQGFDLNPYCFAVANIREQALWISQHEDAALEKTKGIISKAIRFVTHAKSIVTQSLPLKPDVLVIGGGVVGISVAQALAQSGIHVNLIEKSDHLGGKAQELRKFYNRPDEVQTWLDEKISEAKRTELITSFTQTELIHLHGHVGRFEAKVRNIDGVETTLTASAIVAAIGFESQKEKTSIGEQDRVITLREMENLLSQSAPPPFQWDGKKVETVTFLLDGVNEDIKIDSINAVKQALILQEQMGCQAAVLCKDVKVAADGMERLYRKAREQGVLFFKYDDSPKLSVVDGRIQVMAEDTAALQKAERWPVSILSDLLVTGEAFMPAAETENLSKVLKIHLGPRGFLMEDNPQLVRVRTNRRGIFAAGACRFPQEVSESLIEARAAVEEVIGLLSKGVYTYDLAVAEVDPKKCAVCYTCPRLCPHSAITVEKYAEGNVYLTPGGAKEGKWGAAKVDPAACFGCGICVAECPAKAIAFHHETDEQIFDQMALGE